MKRLFVMLLVLVMELFISTALAEEMGVRIIGGPDMGTETVSLDDIHVGDEVEIPGYAIVSVKEYSVKDKLGHYFAGKTEPSGSYPSYYYRSGEDADYALLYVDLTNLSTKSKDFLNQCEVQVIYDEAYKYSGWAYQQNYNNASANGWYDNDNDRADVNEQNTKWVIDSSDNFAIAPMYSGHYIFGCTLPVFVVGTKAPLRMEITIDGNVINYNIR